MGKLIKRPVKSQILGSSSSLKTRENNPFSFKTTSDIFAPPLGTVSTTYTVATGGTITTSGDYKIHTFNSSDNFVVTSLGTSNTVEYLVVAGGGAGASGFTNSNAIGGGGAGGFKTNPSGVIAIQTYSVVIGSGGSSTAVNPSLRGTNGNDSSFGSISTSTGGGAGGIFNNTYKNGANGGSGGGGGSYSIEGTGGTGLLGQGYDGGIGVATGQPYNGGGGGGAGAIGGSVTPGLGNSPGTGGVGLASSISGTSTFYSGGGGGGSNGNSVGGNGGGGGGRMAVQGIAGTVNTGGGGGAGGCQIPSTAGGNGGSGIVIIKYKFQ